MTGTGMEAIASGSDRPGPDSVNLEYVAGHHHKLGQLGSHHPAERSQAIDPSLGIPCLRIFV